MSQTEFNLATEFKRIVAGDCIIDDTERHQEVVAAITNALHGPTKKIHILKAQGIQETPPPSVAIIIDEEISTTAIGAGSDNVLQRSEEAFWDQAKLLSEALYDALPQGTRWRLIVQLMLKEVTLFYGNDTAPLDCKLLNWLDTMEDLILFRTHGHWQLDTSDSILDSEKFSGATVREALTHGYSTFQKKAQSLADGQTQQIVEIIGPDGKVHYTRPFNHPDVLEAIRTPGYSLRGVSNGSHT